MPNSSLFAANTDKNGVAPNTVSLPSGPGSIEGLGEAFQPMLNTGTARYAVKISLPPGISGHNPELKLQYDSGLGSGPPGLGWTFGPGAISRQVDNGLPLYVDSANGRDDDMDGVIDEADEIDTVLGPDGEELVLLADGSYRARIEGNFARYRRVDSGWEVDLKSGTTLTFGKSSSSRVTDSSGSKVYRWLLEKSVDTSGNVIEYTYAAFPGSENQKYLSEIHWGPGASPWGVYYFASFSYEDRLDWRKDYRSGFLVKTGKRLARIDTGISGNQPAQCLPVDRDGNGTHDAALINRYTLAYNDSSHVSLLSSVTRYGSDGENYLPPISFTYSSIIRPQTLSARDADTGSENAPTTLMDSGLAEFIDLNRDGLPDILKTDLYGGAHTAFLNLGEEARPGGKVVKWDNSHELISPDQLAAQLHLAKDAINLADMNGDGISDLVFTTVTKEVFFHTNNGDLSWGPRQPMSIQDTAPPAPFSSKTISTADLDFNKRMDVMKTTPTGLSIWFNQADGKYSREVRTPGATHQGRVMLLSDPGAQLADMNGDRITDMARVTPTAVIYAAAQGYGLFDTTVSMAIPDLALTDGSGGQIDRAKLRDINGDGLDDLVVERAAANELWFWLNLGTDTFSRRYTITDMPSQFGSNTAIRWADLNGNGTTDLVYVDSTAEPPLRMIDLGVLISGSAHPFLLTGVDNGLGATTAITYRPSTEHYLEAKAAGKPWTTTVPFPSPVVSKVVTSSNLDADGNGSTANDIYIKEYTFRDGFYEDLEKQFRGFAEVKVIEPGDASALTRITTHNFFTGGPDKVDNDGDSHTDEVTSDLHREEEALKGMVRSLEVRAVDDTLFSREENSWQVMNLLVSPSGIEIRYPFNTQADKLIYEGQSTPATLRTTFVHDQFGNLIEERKYGSLAIAGDEVFAATTYINDTTRWLLGIPVRQTVTNADGVKAAETVSYYDGAAFTGLAEGQAERGNVSRQQGWVSGSNYVDLIRNEYDAYGNILTILDPNGSRRAIAWDATLHAFPVREDIEVGGGAADLTVRATFNLGLGVVVESIDMNGHSATYDHDTFGRLTSLVQPGDTQALPTQSFSYTMADPWRGLLYSYDGAGKLTLATGVAPTASMVSSRAREVSGEEETLDTIQYVDGLGRKLAQVAEAENGFVVNGATLFNAQGLPRFTLLPYAAGMVTYTPPPLTGYGVETRYDAAGRPVTTVNPPDANGLITSAAVKYLPLEKIETDENGISKNLLIDGLERLIAVHEHNQNETWITRYTYDTLGDLTKIVDAQNNVKSMAYDGLKRKTHMEDPDKGRMNYAFDAAGNLLGTEDNKGQSIAYVYDKANRMLSEDYLDAAGISPDVEYHYDTPAADYPDAANLKGKLAWVRDLSGGKFISYDSRGNAIWSVNRIKDGAATTDYRTTNDYDALGRVTASVFPDNDLVRFQYNQRGLLEAIPGFVTGIDYLPSGQTATFNLANDAATTYAYDPRNRLSELRTTTPAAAMPIQDLAYDFDGVGNIMAISDKRTLPGGSPRNESQNFGYDDLYRLTSAQGPVYGAIGFQYDRIGNMTWKGSPASGQPGHIADPLENLGAMTIGGSGAGAWNRGPRHPGDQPGPHAVTATASGLQYGYDANGNMTEHAGSDRYQWDFKDRLARAEADGGVSTFTYDHAGQRVTKRVEKDGESRTDTYVTDGFELRDGRPVKHIFADSRRVARVEGRLAKEGEFSRQYLHLQTGWNFLALTVEPENPATAVVLAGISTTCQEVWAWDAAGQRYVGYAVDGSTSELATLHADTGYLIRVSEPVTLVVSGSRKTGAVDLVAGWNLVPLPADEAKPTGTAFAGLDSKVEAVWGYAPEGEWQSWLPGQPLWLNSLGQVEPGRAYWVFMNSAATLAYQTGVAKVQYYHPDHLGSSSLATDGSGTVVEEIQYYPFGRLRHEERLGLESEYKYTDKELDKDTGLMYYEARYYDAVIGRFLSVDPLFVEVDGVGEERVKGLLGNPLKENLYAYVKNSPINYIDKLGLYEEIKDFRLHQLEKITLEGNKNKVVLNYMIADKIKQWFELNNKSGISLKISEVFRTTLGQENMVENPNAKSPAKPGNSLHEAGLAIDIRMSFLTEEQKNIVIENAQKIGISWGGNFNDKKLAEQEKHHFYFEVEGGTSNRSKFINSAQKDFKTVNPLEYSIEKHLNDEKNKASDELKKTR